MFFSLPKNKLKIENNVKKKVKKVLQNGYKYPQNSLYSFFISFLNGYGHILTFKIGESRFELFTFVFSESITKSSTQWSKTYGVEQKHKAMKKLNV